MTLDAGESVGLPVLWRAKVRSELAGVVHADAVEYCWDQNVIGTGWGLEGLPDGAPFDQVYEAVKNRNEPRWGRRTALMLRRLAEEAAVGDFVWTRDTSGRYLLGRIAGPYRYDASGAARAVDLYNVRPARWAPRRLNDLEVPGAVIRTFVGPGPAWCRIHDAGARRLTPYLWEMLNGNDPPALELSQREVLTSCLDPADVEDLIYVWLQVERDYIALPRTRQPATPAYEWTMIHRQTRRRAIVQVKTGGTPVDLQELANAVVDDETDTYAFATSGSYEGPRELVTEIIDPEEVLSLARAQPTLLPARVRSWFERATPEEGARISRPASAAAIYVGS